MIDFLLLLGCALTGLFRSRARLEAEILVLRQQINVLRRKSPKRPAFSNIDRLLLVWLSPSGCSGVPSSWLRMVMLNAAVFCARATVGSRVSGAASTSQASARPTATSPHPAKCPPPWGPAPRPLTPPDRRRRAASRHRLS